MRDDKGLTLVFCNQVTGATGVGAAVDVLYTTYAVCHMYHYPRELPVVELSAGYTRGLKYGRDLG
jgi:hypothetical protein